MCPALNRRVKILASQKRIIYEPTNSFYQVLSAEAYSKHGFNIHGVVFNAEKIPVAVIHPASAGHGLNLQAGGSTLVWFGLTWSLELYQQTNARLWRQGQESGTVVIQHIITKGTIDERIVKALSKKEMTQTALIDAVKADLEVV